MRKPPEFTLAAYARLVGIDRHALAAKAEKAGLKPSGKITTGKASGADAYRLRDLVSLSMSTPLQEEERRKFKAQADAAELKNARLKGELIPLVDVENLAVRIADAMTGKIAGMGVLTDAEKDDLIAIVGDFRKIDWSKPK